MKVNPLTGKARDALALEPAWITAYEGSVRSGKTWASLLDWLKFIRTSEPGNLLMTGRTERTIYQNLLTPLQDMLGPHRVHLNRGTGQAEILGRPVMVIGANNEAARTKIQGLSLVGAYVDEASTLPESYFNMLGTRLSGLGARMWLTSNPEGPAHWLKKDWLDRAKLWLDADGTVRRRDPDDWPEGDPERPKDLHRVTFRLDDNPNLPPEYVQRVKASYTGLWYRRYIEGAWCIAEGAVYPDWDEARHVLPPDRLPEIDRVLALGIDWGSTNPTRGILVGLSREESPRLVALDEWAPPKLSTMGFIESLQAWFAASPWPRPEWLFVDSSAAGFRTDLFTMGGFTNVGPATHRVVSGISTVASLLAADKLVVSSSCVKLREEIPSYTWDPKATERGEDAPNKAAGNDHSCDALRYAVQPSRLLWQAEVGLSLVG